MLSKVWVGLIALVTFLFAVVALGAIGTPMGHSYGFNMSWTLAFTEALGPASVYPRFLPDLWDGVGGLDFFFYAPLPFYVTAGPAQWLCPGCSPQVVFGVTGGLLCWLSGVTFWVFARQFLPPTAALFSSLLWALAPYHLGIDWMFRQAAGEFAAYVFVPLVCHGVLVALRDQRPALSLPLGLAGLGFSHLPTLLLVAHVLVVIVGAWLLVFRRHVLRSVTLLTVMGGAGVALSAVYWLPAVVLLGDVSPDGLYTKELVPDYWFLFGLDTYPDSKFRIALLMFQVVACIVAALAVTVTRGNTRKIVTIWALLPAVLVLLLNGSFSQVLWDNWIIQKVQFPYRLTVMSDLALALAAGSVLYAFQTGRCTWRRVSFGAGVLVLSFAALGVLVPDRIARGVAARGESVVMRGAPEYLPPAVFDPLAAEVQAADAPIWELPQYLLDFVATIDMPASGFIKPVAVGPRQWLIPSGAFRQADPVKPVHVALMYWSHLQATTVDGVPVALSWDTDSGFVTLEPVGEDVRILLPYHWSEKAGLAMTIAGLILAAAFGLWAHKRTGRELANNLPPK
ncbi:hypothetical protein [Ruegeria sp.]|uniref:hypothetical protein n=1 Tax=Ruegeria sp. TaxID=1879320 RepID=UPI003C7B821E